MKKKWYKFVWGVMLLGYTVYSVWVMLFLPSDHGNVKKS